MPSKRVLIVEDELITAHDIKEALENNNYIVSEMVRTGEKGLMSVKKNTPDAVIMDVHLLGEITGVEAAYEIAIVKNIPVIFLTATEDMDLISEIQQMRNVNFLAKPLRISELITNLTIAINKNKETSVEPPEEKSPDAVFVPVKNGHRKLFIDDLFYIEASGSYVTIINRHEPIVISTNLGKLHKQIGNHIFVRISKSYIVNIKCIERIENNALVINGQSLPIGDSFRNELLNKLQIIKTK